MEKKCWLTGYKEKRSREDFMYLCFIYTNAICIKEPLNNNPQSKWYFNSKYHKDQRKFKSNSELFNKGQLEVDREKKIR